VVAKDGTGEGKELKDCEKLAFLIVWRLLERKSLILEGNEGGKGELKK